jgi:hypothetical protein
MHISGWSTLLNYSCFSPHPLSQQNALKDSKAPSYFEVLTALIGLTNMGALLMCRVMETELCSFKI